MFAADIGKMSDSETSSFYSYAWLLTHYLRFEPKRKGQLNAYLRAFAAGKPPMDAATGAFGTVKDLENDLQRYMNSSKLSYSAISGITMPTQSIVIEALRAPESDLMPLYIRFLKPHDEAEIAKFVIDARAAAVKYPAEPRALELLAEGELDAEQLAAASKANDALLAIRATDARALLRHARIAAAQMRKSEDYPGGWKAVRSLIVKANRAAPNDPFPLSKYFDAYRSEGIPVPDLAGAGLNRALELSPQAGDLRFTLAAYLIEKDKRDEARIVLAPLLNEPHSPEAREMARRMLDPSGPGIPAIKESEEKNGKSQ